MTLPSNERYWTIEDLCEEFGLVAVTVRSWIKAETLKTIKIGNRHRIYQSQWERFLDRSNGKESQ